MSERERIINSRQAVDVSALVDHLKGGGNAVFLPDPVELPARRARTEELERRPNRILPRRGNEAYRASGFGQRPGIVR